MSSEQILAAADEVRSAGPSAPRPGRDPVNLPMIRNWVEAIGDPNPSTSTRWRRGQRDTTASSPRPRWRRCGRCGGCTPFGNPTTRSAA